MVINLLQEQGAGDDCFTHPTVINLLQEQGAGDDGFTHPTALNLLQVHEQQVMETAEGAAHWQETKLYERVKNLMYTHLWCVDQLQMTGTALLQTSRPADHVGVTTMESL